MVSDITAYMRKSGAKYFTRTEGLFNGRHIVTRFFVNNNFDVVATLDSFKMSLPNGQVMHQSLLRTDNGLTKFTRSVAEMVKLTRYKGKKNVKFPYTATTNVVYNDNSSKKTLFLIKDGVSFEKTDKDGLMLYKTNRKFKTKLLKITGNAAQE